MTAEVGPAERARVAGTLTSRLSELTAALRQEGVASGLDQLLVAHRALAEMDPRLSLARAALRASLCSSPADVASFERVFDRVFAIDPPKPMDPGKEEGTGDGPGHGDAGAKRETGESEGGGAGRAPGALEEPDPGEPQRGAADWSAIEILRRKSFRAYTASDRRLARERLRQLAATLPVRPSRLWRSSPTATERLDLRHTLRHSLRSDGELFELRRRRPRPRPRRLVFVCDVSGSMAPYAGMVLEYVHAVLRTGHPTEAFCFSTRLSRVTMELGAADPARALARAEATVVDRSGGTRIGAAIASLNREHGHRLGRGAIVVVLSDGWDRGEPGLLGREMARLRRTAHAVLWLDPHLAVLGYEPLTRGMREALPHVRNSFPGDSLAGLEMLSAAERELS